MHELLTADSPATASENSPTAQWTDRVAQRLAAEQDAHMGQAILSLYRSATQLAMSQAGHNVSAAAAAPGLVIDATADHTTGSSVTRTRMVGVAGAATAQLHGLGHW